MSRKKIERKLYGVEESREILVQEIQNQLIEEIKEPQNILNKRIKEKISDDYIEIEVIYEVIEEIGTNEKIE